MTMNKLLLKNAFIHPITRAPFHGDILIEDGKIRDLGLNLKVSADMKIVDCNRLYLFPGFIDVHTHLGLYDEGTGWAGNDANETSEPMSPHVRALDGIYPLDPAFLDAVKAGITTVHVMPGSANIIGDKLQSLKLAAKVFRK